MLFVLENIKSGSDSRQVMCLHYDISGFVHVVSAPRTFSTRNSFVIYCSLQISIVKTRFHACLSAHSVYV